MSIKSLPLHIKTYHKAFTRDVAVSNQLYKITWLVDLNKHLFLATSTMEHMNEADMVAGIEVMQVPDSLGSHLEADLASTIAENLTCQ